MTKRERMILQNSLRILRKELHPRRIILFGSRAKGTNRKGSDFDLALDCRAPKVFDEDRIHEKLGEGVGLYHIDMVFLPSVSRGFRNIILNTGKVVYLRHGSPKRRTVPMAIALP